MTQKTGNKLGLIGAIALIVLVLSRLTGIEALKTVAAWGVGLALLGILLFAGVYFTRERFQDDGLPPDPPTPDDEPFGTGPKRDRNHRAR